MTASPPFGPVASTSSLLAPPSPSAVGPGSLGARRKLNKKSLSLVVPNAGSAAPLTIQTPTTPALLRPDDGTAAETRSLPPSPVSLAAYIGVEGAEAEDRTIGRLMLKQQADEMREQMKGGRGMKRRTSIPTLARTQQPQLSATLNKLSLNDPPSRAVQLVRREEDDDDQSDALGEEFPYALGPREILPGVFLGSEVNASDPSILSRWNIGAVLNVAKEVECPWTDERVAAVKHKHRRTKTHAAIIVKEHETKPVRPQFVRPTVSTPNLQQAFLSVAAPPPPPPLPTISSPIGLRFPRNPRTGRPEIEYLWLKWGHDEADLVEAGKFQAAFDFLDHARAAGQRTLVHCQCGVSRSATVVIAYCMREAANAIKNNESAGELEGLKGMHDTYSFVKEKSEWVGPNLGLVFQLVAYERSLRGGAGAYDEEEEQEPPYPE